MSTNNLIGGVVKILEIPNQQTLNNTFSVTQFRAQFPQARQNCIVHLKFWGNLAHDVATYYKVNDYILIEGYMSFRSNESNSLQAKPLKHIEISVFKVYPLFLKNVENVLKFFP